MFYTTDQRPPLPFNPFKALVAPRPIGWISSLDPTGRANLAPYSFFNAVGQDLVMFSSTGRKHSAANAIATGEFVCNFVTYDLRDAMNSSSGPYGEDVDEFEVAGLEKARCRTVTAPRVAAAPAALECRTVHSIELENSKGDRTGDVMIVGHVTAVHIDDELLRDGRFDTLGADPIMRMGYKDYGRLGDRFEMDRPSA